MDRPPQMDNYGSAERDDVLPHVPGDISSVMDVGCASGGFGASLRTERGDAVRIVGIDAVPSQAVLARGRGFDVVYDGYFPDDLPSGERFDLITFNDVLEHLVDPWAALRACHAHLNPGGRVLAAIPSIQHADTLIRLLRGRWDYSDIGGTLDRTHLRFFTPATMKELFRDTGFDVEHCVGINGHEKRWGTDPMRPRRAAKLALARAMGNFNFLQYVLIGRSPDGRVHTEARPNPKD